MGMDKAFIKIDGIPMIQRVYEIFQQIFNEIIIVTNQKDRYSDFRAKVVTDLIRDCGVLGGLYTGLYHASNFYSFCAACDMPFLKIPLIRFLSDFTEGYDAIVPKTADGLQPLHAIYSKNCLKPIPTIIELGKYRLTDLYPLVNTKIVDESEFIHFDPQKESFFNINTPEDLNFIKEETKAYS